RRNTGTGHEARECQAIMREASQLKFKLQLVAVSPSAANAMVRNRKSSASCLCADRVPVSTRTYSKQAERQARVRTAEFHLADGIAVLIAGGCGTDSHDCFKIVLAAATECEFSCLQRPKGTASCCPTQKSRLVLQHE